MTINCRTSALSTTLRATNVLKLQNFTGNLVVVMLVYYTHYVNAHLVMQLILIN